MDFLKNNIVGQLGDQIGTLWLGDIFYTKKFYLYKFYSILFYKEGSVGIFDLYFSNIYNFIYLSLASIFGSILAYNLLTLIFLCLNSYSLYLVLKNLKIDNRFSYLYSFLFSLIPYFYFHFEHHSLIAIFPSILIINFLVTKKVEELKFWDFVNIVFLINLQGIFSTYLVYFLLIYLFLFFLITFWFERSLKTTINFIKITFFSGLLFIILNFTLVVGYFSPNSTNETYSFPVKELPKYLSSFSFEREKPINDFLYFSSRPWYYFLFPTNNILFGEFTKNIIYYFSDTKNIWIFKNHFPYEHNTSFLGFTVLILNLYFVIFVKGKKYQNFKKLFYLNIFLFILSMPPLFTIKNFVIYTPSYILFELFPMFRTLARFSVFIQINLFIISALSTQFLSEKISFGKFKIIFLIIIIGFFIDYSSYIKFSEVKYYPKINSYLLEKNTNNLMIAVYPNSFRNEFLLNMKYYEKPFFNPSGFVKSEINYDSGKFTNSLDTCESLNYFKMFNGGFIVIKDIKKYDLKNLNRLKTEFESLEENVTVKSLTNLNEVCKL